VAYRGTGLIGGALAFACLALAAASVPAHAQQNAGSEPVPARAAPATDRQNPNYIAVDLNLRRSQLYRRGDTVGVAALYTEDAAYTELLPMLQVLKGRDQIKGHLDELISASALTIAPTVQSAERNADGTLAVSGDYVVLTGDDTRIIGHFIQTLRQENGEWRIASHTFARPDPLTQAEADRSD